MRIDSHKPIRLFQLCILSALLAITTDSIPAAAATVGAFETTRHAASTTSPSAISTSWSVDDHDKPLPDEPLPKVSESRLKEILAGDAPKSVAELAAMETHFKKLVDKVKPAIVGVRVGDSQGSGVIISRDGFVLTAGHVVGQANQNVVFILPDGKRLRGKTLGANFQIDSGLMQITEEGSWPYVDMGDSSDLSQGQWVMAVGHPGGYEEGRTPVVRIGRILNENSNSIRTDCALVGGDSGGPLFDMNGQVVGINSRIGSELTANIHVPINTYAETWDRLASAEEWGAFQNAARTLRQPRIGVERDTQASEARIAKVDEDVLRLEVAMRDAL